MKAFEIKALEKEYGSEATLGQVFKCLERPYQCPQCDGAAVCYKTRSKNTFLEKVLNQKQEPEGLLVTCDLCDGQGWTEKEFVPKLIQAGWE